MVFACRHLLLGFLILGICLISAGQAVARNTPGEYLVNNWTTADGLPENTVRAIVETRDGYLWLGTANGLARFDGVRFKRFNSANTPDLFVDDIFGLQEDRAGDLWVSTRRAVLRYHQNRFVEMKLPGSEVMPTLGNLTRDREGNLWMHGPAGIVWWDGQKLEAIPKQPEGPERVTSLCAAPAGGLWIASANGLWRYEGGRMERVPVAPLPQIITATPDGRLWGLVEERQLFVWENDRWSLVTDFGEERYRTLVGAPNGDVWVGAASGPGSFRVRGKEITEISRAHGLEGNRAICFRPDREGNIWIGMNGAGLYRLRERRVRVLDQRDGLQSLALTSICEDAQGAIWVNVMGWNLHRLTGERFAPVEIAAYGQPTALVPAGGSGLWAGTFYGGLSRVQNGTITTRLGAEAGTRCLFVDRDGGVWRGTRTDGVEHIVGTNVTRYRKAQGLAFDNVYCLTQDREGAIWAGTEEGLSRIANGRITGYGITNGLGHRFITALTVDSRGTLWAGTQGGGLSGWNGTRFLTLTTQHGLADDTVTQLIEDDLQHLWIGSRAGLKRVPVSQLAEFLEGKRSVVTGPLVGRNEGLVRPDTWTEYQPAGIKSRDGRLWFCTSSGVVVVDPRRFLKPAPAPMVHVEEVTVDGRAAPERTEPERAVRIPAGAERVELHYTGISPSGADLVRFRYQLQGYDRGWVEAGHVRLANYTRVSPGRYAFVVQAVNNDGVWNAAGDTLALVFEPKVWQTKWFRAGLVLVLLGCGPALYLWRVRRLERRRKAQEAFSRKLIFSQEQERQRIAAELHDSLGQNLLVIKNRAALALAQREQPEKVIAQVAEVSVMASAAIREVREIAQNLRPFQLDELGLTKAIVAMSRNLADASGMEFKTELEKVDGALPPEFEINFYRVVQECLNNIVKHAQGTRATITLRREGASLHLIVADNGRGFDPEKARAGDGQGIGMSNIVERTGTMRGTVSFDSHPGAGTRIEIKVPLE